MSLQRKCDRSILRKQKEILAKENDELKEKVLKLENLLVENKFADLNLNENLRSSPRKTPHKVEKGEIQRLK